MEESAPRKLAVRGSNLCFTYRFNSYETLYALNRLTINIPVGQIYGLLGPSGSGKTSLLRIITGLAKPDTGTISVFGFRPGDKGSGIPGAGIGYMPQEISLHDDLTVNESLCYFGRLYCLPEKELKFRVDGLVDFLEIPDANRQVKCLSGGQQRRLSLACAVIHRPRLAILDEPTVGVDPFLCAKIWSLLQRLCSQDKMTIIITTHYIEECRKASIVGFMRAGEILVEDEPNLIMKNYRCASLEEAFLKICLKCKAKKKRADSLIAPYLPTLITNSLSTKDPDSDRVLKQPMVTYRDTHVFSAFFISILTLFWRYLIQSIRNPVYLVLFVFFPSCALVTLYLTIGRAPSNLPVAWIVEDVADYNVVHANVQNYSQAYDTYLIPFYPDVIKSQLNSSIINLVAYEKLDDAIEDVKKLRLKAALLMRPGFSEALHSRADLFTYSDLDAYTIQRGKLELYADLSNRFVMMTVELCLEYAMLQTLKITAPTFNASLQSRQLPIRVQQAVEGSIIDHRGLDMAEYLVPGFILMTMFSCGFALSCLAFMSELESKVIQRIFSTGISSVQLIMAQTFTRFILFAPNVFLLLFLAISIFKITFHGSFILATTLICLQTYSGIALGICFAAIFRKLEHAVFSSIAVFLIIMDISGIIWPLRGLPYFIHDISLLSPFTKPSIALQSIFTRSHPSYSALIWPGFYSSIIWSILPILVSLLVFKIKCD